MKSKLLLFLLIAGGALVVSANSASACGGFFCQNNPVDQIGERIVFTANGDGTITTLIEIQYTGSADDFSWVLPIPEAIDADALRVPDEGETVFDELHLLTDVQIIAPKEPGCVQEVRLEMATADAATSLSGVDVFASGEVGPFGFDVIGSEDPGALIGWLRDNNYRVTEAMEPLLNVYVEEEMAFVAMRLLDGETSDSIQPIEITYGGTEPMIPLRLTAVAAQPNMPVWVWIFADHQAVSTNFENMEIANEEITFFPFGGNDYTFLVQQRANALNGQSFITEYAQPVDAAAFHHPWLAAQAEGADYLTRLNTYIDPEEMTIDPVFGFDADAPDVSNIRDATDLEGLYSCERDGGEGFLSSIFGGSSDAIDPMDGTGQVVAFTPDAAAGTTSETDGIDSDQQTPTDPDENAAIDADTASDGTSNTSDDSATFAGVALTIVLLLAGLGVVLAVFSRRPKLD